MAIVDDALLLFRAQRGELEADLTPVEGELPAGLRGTLLRNGPGILKIGADLLHPLDGLGAVMSVRIEGGRASARLRHVRSPTFLREAEATGQRLRHIFTNKPSRWSNLFDLRLANSAAHDVYLWGGEVVATDGPGHYRMDPRTLDTLGGAPVNRFVTRPGAQISPMPRWDKVKDRLVLYSVLPGTFGNDRVTVLELDRQWNTLASQEYELPGKNLFFHDICFSEGHYVLVQAGTARPGRLLWGEVPPYSAIELDEARIFLLPRGGGPTRVASLPKQQIFHLFNAFEEGGRLTVDTCAYADRIEFLDLHEAGVRAGKGPGLPQVRRHEVDLSTMQVQSRDVGAVVDGPEVNAGWHGRRHRFGYGPSHHLDTGNPALDGTYFFFRSLVKVDFEGGQHRWYDAPPRSFVSGAQLAPFPDAKAEDDGWLLALTFDAASDRSGLLVLDARDMSVVARLGLPFALPMHSHLHWAEDRP